MIRRWHNTRTETYILFMDNLEDLVYCQMRELLGPLSIWPRLHGVDTKLISSIIMIERQQYNLPQALRVFRRCFCTIQALIQKSKSKQQDGEKWQGLKGWINNSRGFSRIKKETAFRALILQPPDSPHYISPAAVEQYSHDPDLSIRLTCLIIATHQRQWFNFAGELPPEILATLYNISDFTNKPPHPNPRSGGSVLPAVIDGYYLENLNFGERVKKVYESRKMSDFVSKIKMF